MHRVATFAFVLGTIVAWNGSTFGQVDVVVRGQLKTGIFAIGGETTGTIITAKNITYELDLRKLDLSKTAEQLNGKQVIVEGRLNRRPGVEVGERWIIDVTRLEGKQDAEDNTDERKASEASLSVKGHRLNTVVKFSEAAVIDVQCQFGNDRMTLSRTSDEWPEELVIRLHITRMESFVIQSENIRVSTSFGDKARGVNVTDVKSKEKIVSADDWLRVGRVGNQKKGYMLIELRQPLLKHNPQSFDLSWVTVYLN